MMLSAMMLSAMVLAVLMVLQVGGPAAAQAPDWERVVRPASAAKKAQAQATAQPRPPARVIVRPLPRNRHDATEFPRTDTLGYPGPNAVRQCRAWLATEHRVSGTVVTPQMRCWWQRG